MAESSASPSPDYKALVQRLEQRLRLKSFPLGLRWLERKEDLAALPFLRRPRGKVTFCQVLNQARNFNFTVGVELPDFLFPACPSILGLCPVPASHADGSFRSIVWTARKDQAARFEAAIQRVPAGRYQAVAVAPLAHQAFPPDLAMIYANPAQIVLILSGWQYAAYETLDFHFVGESSCSDAIARCLATGKPALALPCFGERRFGHLQDEELALALPPADLPRVVLGLDRLYRSGIRYPICYAGAEADFTPSWPAAYFALDQSLADLAAGQDRLLVGLAGGSAEALAQVGQALARRGAEVLAWEELTWAGLAAGEPLGRKLLALVGPGAARPDGGLDPDRLARLLADNPVLRKKAEPLLDQAALAELGRRVRDLVERRPGVRIFVLDPRLLERSHKHLLDRVGLVTVGLAQVPPELGLMADFRLDLAVDLANLEAEVERAWPEMERRG